MKFRKSKEDEPHISIAPLIDIVFLLLIFFMVTSHFDIASGVKIDLPKVGQKAISDGKDNKITLVIDKSGEVYLEGEKISNESLQKKLKDFSKKGGLTQLILQADKDTAHGKVVEIMDLAKSSGVNSIVIAARWKSEKPK
jgi:biopolymer transport protein ExbD